VEAAMTIIFVREYFRQAAPFDIRPAILSAKKWSPNSRIVLLGDEHQPKDLCEFYHMEDYSVHKEALRKMYRNNDEPNEWFLWTTLAQWLVTFEWMKANGIDRACCLDTDVLVFADLDVECSKFKDCDLTLSCPTTSCQAPTIISIEALERFVKWILDFFAGKDPVSYEQVKVNGLNSMYLWTLFLKVQAMNGKSLKTMDTSQVIGGTTWCHNFGMDYHDYEWNGEGKVVSWLKGCPYIARHPYPGCTQVVRFNTIHAWGVWKSRMDKFLECSQNSLAL
jgi:hypothetical protein